MRGVGDKLASALFCEEESASDIVNAGVGASATTLVVKRDDPTVWVGSQSIDPE